MSDVLYSVDICITDHMTIELQKPFIKEDILEAINQMSPTKTLGPDGTPTLFYQKFYHIMSSNIFTYSLDILNNNVDLASFNHTHIYLIPKNNNPKTTKEYRPYSLCNMNIKLIIKTIANRLK